MIAALIYLTQTYLGSATDQFFDWQMRRAAIRITSRRHLVHRRRR
jgi:hypothetical protein